MIIMYKEPIGDLVHLVHEAANGRYELTGYDLHVIEAALQELSDMTHNDSHGEDVKVESSKTDVGGMFSVWSTECPSCKQGRVLLFEKGGLGKCDKCKKTFFTDFEEHPELGTPETEYWLMD